MAGSSGSKGTLIGRHPNNSERSLKRLRPKVPKGLEDIYKAHRGRPLAEHVADWIAELKQLSRNDVYVRLCESRMARLIDECGWGTLGAINAESLHSLAANCHKHGWPRRKGWDQYQADGGTNAESLP